MRMLALFLLICVFSAAAADEPAGQKIYEAHCAQCHDAKATSRIPPRAALEKMTSKAILKTLTTGVMKQQGSRLSAVDRAAVSLWLAKAPAPAAPVTSIANPCPSNQTPSPKGADWAEWGNGASNSRYQPVEMDAPRLKLKWAFGLPNVSMMRSQPAVYKGRVYLGGDNGVVYSLDAQSGCVYWAMTTKQVRSGIAIAEGAVFFGDVTGGVTALDAASGKQLWNTHAGDHPNALVTGTPAYSNGLLYVPVSSYEELAAIFPGSSCCSFRGSVVALDARTGSLLWRTHTIASAATAQGKSSDGRTVFGPSGAAIWASPTVDSSDGRLYVTTGDNYSQPTTDTSDALFALDLKTGKILWSKQFTKGDAFNVSCGEPGKGNCPVSPGKDLDFGSSPVLVSLPSGKRELLLAQKSGFVYAVDPDEQGKLLWQARAGEGGALGGIQWGPATDGNLMYVAVADVRLAKSDAPGKLNLDSTKGGGLMAYRVDNGQRVWTAPPPGCKERRPCSPAQSAAVTAIPGAVFSGSLDGHIRAYNAKTGAIIWDFDTERDFDTVDHAPAHGGSIDVAGPVVAGGMVFVESGYPQYGGAPGNVLLAFEPE
jgi:polyvinyl alcohol dehydrogenase (cytochrome)